jgi:hypothetical protein
MAIYDIFDHVETIAGREDVSSSQDELHRHFSEFTLSQNREEPTPASKDRLFSSIAARLFFFILLLADIVWGVYSTILFFLSLSLHLIAGCKLSFLKKKVGRFWLSIKRSFICGISLFVAIFSPALGTMFACTYFLMYDKKGIEEVVPSVLQDQFREFFSH